MDFIDKIFNQKYYDLIQQGVKDGREGRKEGRLWSTRHELWRNAKLMLKTYRLL